MRLGLALSGGGSRAAAFHRGTLRGLAEVHLLDGVDVVSTVSGGSVFAAAWMAARWKGLPLEGFLERIASELARGFIARSINWRAFKLAMPSYTRSNLLAETFDRVLMHGMTLQDLPQRPVLCLNTTVMNTGQVGRFSREGFSSTGIRPPGADPRSNPMVALPRFPIADAATASAAFPIGLPPVYLLRGRDIPKDWGEGGVATHRRLALTDGGVLENLGVQTLLKSKRFGAWDIILSDAGLKDPGWEAGGFVHHLRGLCMGLLSLPVIERVTVMMSDKQDRHMRVGAFDEMERSWLVRALRAKEHLSGVKDYLETRPNHPPRRVLFIRLNQKLHQVMSSIPPWRRAKAERANLNVATELHTQLGGDARIDELNRIPTGFGRLSRQDIDDLELHARWQAHAMHALYWHERDV